MPADRSIQDNQPDISLFLAVLHPDASLGDIKVGRTGLKELWEFGVRYNVSLLLCSRLTQEEGRLTDDARIFLKKQRSHILGRAVCSLRQGFEEQRILDLLRAHGSDACIIKGNDIAQRIYGDAVSRSSSDIDILIREQDILGVDGLLCDAGYIRVDQVPLGFWLERIHHAAYLHRTNGHAIEVHWSFGIPSFFTLSSAEIWNGTEQTGTGRIALSPEMQAIQMLMHHHMHAFREFRSLVDLLWIFFVYGDVIDWERFFSRLKRIGLVKTAQISMHQFMALWGDSCGKMKALQALQAACRREGYPEPKVLCRYFRFFLSGANTSHPMFDKLVMRFALDRNATIWRSFLKSFLPSPEAVKTLYDDERSWKLPLHYLRFLRWRLKEWSVN